jgi:choline kinase
MALKKIHGIILAAGRGSRMNDLTEDRPKGLVKFGNKALIDWQIDALVAAGIEQIDIVTGYKAEALEHLNCTRIFNERWQKTNMLSSLLKAEHLLTTTPCIVSYSDIFYAKEAIIYLAASDADIAITYDPNWRLLWQKRFEDPLDDAETFALHSDSTLRDIGGKTNNIEDIEGQYMGLLYFTPTGWSHVQDYLNNYLEQVVDQMSLTSLLSSLIERGQKILAVPYYGQWGEIDSENDLRVFELLLPNLSKGTFNN